MDLQNFPFGMKLLYKPISPKEKKRTGKRKKEKKENEEI